MRWLFRLLLLVCTLGMTTIGCKRPPPSSPDPRDVTLLVPAMN